eukprot:scaffold130808_cov63-Phaeocystis_antarctica.AAC.2
MPPARLGCTNGPTSLRKAPATTARPGIGIWNGWVGPASPASGRASLRLPIRVRRMLYIAAKRGASLPPACTRMASALRPRLSRREEAPRQVAAAHAACSAACAARHRSGDARRRPGPNGTSAARRSGLGRRPRAVRKSEA